jgi:hypothetical protein
VSPSKQHGYDLYGVDATTLEEAKGVVEQALGIRLVAHESGYAGGDYYRYGSSGAENFILQRNFDPRDQCPFESKFSDSPFILYVSETSRWIEIQAQLCGVPRVKLLRHELL